MWKKILNYEKYEVSENGEIRSLQSGNPKIMKPCFGQTNYYRVCLSKNGKLKTFYVHRLVAQAFVPNTFNKKQINHKNGIKTDNRKENLEWVTPSENTLHAYKNGLAKAAACFTGKFGKEHCRSRAYTFINPKGEEVTFYSAYECKRKTGIRNMTLSDVVKKHGKNLPYTFKRGVLKGYKLISYFKPYISKYS